MTSKSLKIAQIEAFPLHPRAVKEAWTEDDYVWPSELPSYLSR